MKSMEERCTPSIILGIILLTIVCTGGPLPSYAATPGPIIAHTSGIVSKRSAIRVIFSEEVGGGGSFPRAIKQSPFDFRPELSGEAVWTSSRSLEFRPDRDLVPGKSYTVALDLPALMEVTKPPRTFTFDFTVMVQSMEIAADGLQAGDPKDPEKQRFTGRLVTADVADAGRVEKVLTMALGSRPLKISWQHSPDGKIHRFQVERLLRSDQDASLVMSWDGSPIGADQRGEREFILHAADTFDVLFARPDQSAERMVEIRMTDPLDPRQDLSGLVTVDGKDVKTDRSGNRLSIYLPASRPSADRESVSVVLDENIRNRAGRRLGKTKTLTVTFEEIKPQARFVGEAAVVPTTHGLTVPIETANLQRITVSALRIQTRNLPQFLQVNNLDGDSQLKRVGRIVWRHTIDLNWRPEMKNRWVRHGLDLTELVRRHPGGMFQLTLSFRYQDVDFRCIGAKDHSAMFEDIPAPDEGNADAETETSYWDNMAAWGGYQNWSEFYQNRNNPCHPAYYMRIGDHDVTAGRNVLISDIGLLAKRGDGDEILLVATDIRSAAPIAGVAIDVMNFQQEVLASGITDERGMAMLETGCRAVPGRRPPQRTVGLSEARRRLGQLPQPLRRGRGEGEKGAQGVSLRGAGRLEAGRHPSSHLHPR